jgi:hypothetical protein
LPGNAVIVGTDRHPIKEERDIAAILSLTPNPIINSPLARGGEQL